MAVLTEIIKEEKDYSSKIIHIDINKYVIELIRISKFYEFKLKIKRITKLKEKEKPLKKNIADINIEQQINKIKVEEEEIKQYITIKEEINEDNISYADDRIKIKDIEYKIEKPKIRYQELWEKEGFYQEKTTQARVRVQLWPEHLPYDHFKRKRAFLFV